MDGKQKWAVSIDDPSAVASHGFIVEADTREEALLEGARRAIVIDPFACGWRNVKRTARGTGDPWNVEPDERERIAREEPDFVEAVSRYGFAGELRRVGDRLEAVPRDGAMGFDVEVEAADPGRLTIYAENGRVAFYLRDGAALDADGLPIAISTADVEALGKLHADVPTPLFLFVPPRSAVVRVEPR